MFELYSHWFVHVLNKFYIHFSNEARYRQREQYVNHLERPPSYRSLNERHFSNGTRYEREIRRREWRGHRGNEDYHSRHTRGYRVRERSQDERIGHRDDKREL